MPKYFILGWTRYADGGTGGWVVLDWCKTKKDLNKRLREWRERGHYEDITIAVPQTSEKG